jgi:GAF domain-containing protein
MTNQHYEAQVFARAARELSEQDGLPATLDLVPRLARTLTGCDAAMVWTVNRQGQPQMSAATDPALAEAHAKSVLTIAEGAEWECLHARSVVIVDDLRTERRWPVYSRLMARAGEPLVSLVAYPLGRGGADGGALVLASGQPSYFTDGLIDAAAVFADHASVAIRCAAAEDKAANLEQALASNRRIGIALGIVMAGSRCTADQAFDQLRAASQSSHLKLREVAEEVVFTGVLPTTPVPQTA